MTEPFNPYTMPMQDAPKTKGTNWVAIVALIVIGFLGAVIVAAVAMSPMSSDRHNVVTPTTPAPAPSQTVDSQYQHDYNMTTNLLEAAAKGQGQDITGICTAWAIGRQKWTARFANTTVETLDVPYSTAVDAVQDYFDGICG